MPVHKNVEIALKELRKTFRVTTSELYVMIRDFHDEMRLGLSGETSSLKMLPAFIDRPSGDETGIFIGVDLGGTNLRVVQVRLLGEGSTEIKQIATHAIPRKIVQGKGKELFDFIASAISGSVSEKNTVDRQHVSLGFAFSFPVKQTAIDKGTLINWTKGFTASGVVNHDVVALLRKALQRNGVENIQLAALINDTVGTLLTIAYTTKDCDMGVIFGTGTNGCYREKESEVVQLAHPKTGKKMIINTEWGNFNLFSANPYDKELDKRSKNPGSQTLEKMISGLYLGELTRLVVRDLIRQGVFFTKHISTFRKGSLTTEDMAAIEKDRTHDLQKVETFLTKLGIESTFEERRILKKVCSFVSRRAAKISAAAISALITWMDPELRQNHTVAVDGTLYVKYPRFKQNILKTLQQLHGEGSEKIQLSQVQDGSGIGAAIAGAVATVSK